MCLQILPSLMRVCFLSLVFVGLLWAFGLPSPALSQVSSQASSQTGRSEGIAAVVNEDIVTFSDLEARTMLVLVSANLPDTPQMRARVHARVMEILIEEQLKLQEARRYDIEITDADIDRAFGVIAEQNRMSQREFMALLRQQGIPPRTLRQQIHAQMAWTRVVEDILHDQVRVTERDVDMYLEALLRNEGRTEYLVSEIFLPITQPQEESEIRALANDMVREIRAGAIPFGVVAREFSQAAGAQQGGSIGWIQAGQLPEELDRVLLGLSPDQISAPVRTSTGIHILGLEARRTIERANLPAREDITNRIGLERLDRVQRRHLQDLRAFSFIDNRVRS